MKKIAFLHDQDMSFIGGAEYSNLQIINAGISLGYDIEIDDLSDFEKTKALIKTADVTILNNLVKCEYEFDLIDFLLENSFAYVKWEHDYGLCEKRSLYCLNSSRVKNCCTTHRYKQYRNLFAKAILNVFQSPMHLEKHQHMYGDAIQNTYILPPPIQVSKIQDSPEKEKDLVLFLGNLNFVKGGNQLVTFAEENPQYNIQVFGENRLKRRVLPSNISLQEKVPNEEVLKELGKAEYFFFQPQWFEPSGRVAAEAFLSGCKFISNNNVGLFSYDFYPENREEAKRQMEASPNIFWDKVAKAFSERENHKTWKNVLVYKNYGGLGDQFIAIEGILKLTKVSETVTYAVPDNLVTVLQKHVKDLIIIGKSQLDTIDKAKYDKIFNLGNYPKSGRFNNEGVIDYPTHHKIRQHASGHYIDAIANFHPDIDNSKNGFPYFKKRQTEENYFTVHPGAGFSPKWWPEERYISLIFKLLNTFQGLHCKIILGPNDPKPEVFTKAIRARIQLVTGNLDEVAEAVSGAQFHIGNDSGITHFAGVFNIPSVGIHGLTGPGSWATMAEHKEVVWGKPGNCNIKCKYDVAMNCEHRNCLTSISVDTVVEAVYKVVQKAYGDGDALLCQLATTIDIEGKEIIIKNKEKEFLVTFQLEDEIEIFKSLIAGQTEITQITNASVLELIDFLIQEELLFVFPTTYSKTKITSKEKKIQLKDVTLLGVDCVDIERLIFAANISQEHIDFGAVKLLTHKDVYHSDIIKIDPIRNIEAYSKFIMQELYKYVDTPYVMIIQHDGFVLHPEAWNDEFLNYDYIGAHWWWMKDKYTVGNGGFSLRSKRLMELVAKDECIFDYHPEDTVIVRTYGEYLRQKGIKFAPIQLAGQFSIELKKWSGQFGFHDTDTSAWKYDL